ncbi:MAG: hypothetical protein ACPGVB_13845 [Chitinophagales bacterium]
MLNFNGIYHFVFNSENINTQPSTDYLNVNFSNGELKLGENRFSLQLKYLVTEPNDKLIFEALGYKDGEAVEASFECYFQNYKAGDLVGDLKFENKKDIHFVAVKQIKNELLKQLSEETKEKISQYRYDYFVEKHEGPWSWADALEYERLCFILVDNQFVLLPLPSENASNITILQHYYSENRTRLIVHLQDTTWYDSNHEAYLCIAEQIEGEDFYLCTLYHTYYNSIGKTE